MMDLYHFIDSHAIRKHLQSISYPFTTQEVAFLVWYCKTATLEEKHAAWREIIDTMPNCSLEKRLNMEPIPDFHQFLREFMCIERHELESFRSADQCVYFYCPYQSPSQLENRAYGPYSSYERCMEAALADMRAGKDAMDKIRMEKYRLDQTSVRPDYCTFNANGDVLGIDIDIENVQELGIILSFDGMWIDLPTPFHSGDLVCATSRPDEPSALTDICTWNEATLRSELPANEYSEAHFHDPDRILEKLRRCGDTSDMFACGYVIQQENGRYGIWADGFPLCNYLELEYYEKPLTGFSQLLRPVGEYLKGACGIQSFLNQCILLLHQDQNHDA